MDAEAIEQMNQENCFFTVCTFSSLGGEKSGAESALYFHGGRGYPMLGCLSISLKHPIPVGVILIAPRKKG
jgi:hypothetical protein